MLKRPVMGRFCFNKSSHSLYKVSTINDYTSSTFRYGGFHEIVWKTALSSQKYLDTARSTDILLCFHRANLDQSYVSGIRRRHPPAFQRFAALTMSVRRRGNHLPVCYSRHVRAEDPRIGVRIDGDRFRAGHPVWTSFLRLGLSAGDCSGVGCQMG